MTVVSNVAGCPDEFILILINCADDARQKRTLKEALEESARFMLFASSSSSSDHLGTFGGATIMESPSVSVSMRVRRPDITLISISLEGQSGLSRGEPFARAFFFAYVLGRRFPPRRAISRSALARAQIQLRPALRLTLPPRRLSYSATKTIFVSCALSSIDHN